MAQLKKAFGRQIARWKQEAIAANAGASDEDLARIINETARLQGYDYTITPDKVRARATKKRKKRRHARAVTPAAGATPGPPPQPAATGGISVDDIAAVKGLVDGLGARSVQELTGVLSE